MKTTKLVAVSLAVLFGSATAGAQNKKPDAGSAAAPAAPAAAPAAAPSPAPQAPKPAPEFVQMMKPYEGRWRCETKIPPGSMGPGSPEVIGKTTVKMKRDLDGFFYKGDVEMKKSRTNPGWKGTLYIGYEPASKQVLITAVDNMGGMTWGTGTQQGDTIVFNEEGYMMGQKIRSRETMQLKGPKELYHKVEMDMGRGFQLMGEDNCKR